MKTWHALAFIIFMLTEFSLSSCSKEDGEITTTEVILPEVDQDVDPKICTELHHIDSDRAFGNKQNFWQKNLLKVRFLGGSAYVQSKIKQYANEWSKHANIKFQYVTREPSDVRISFDKDGGSWSYVGQSNRYIAAPRATLNFGWFTDRTSDTEFRRTTLHEFGHAIGLSHEHQHPQANIQWNKEAVYAYYQRTQDWTRRDVDENIFQRYGSSTSNYSTYDPSSIMHYYIPKSLVLGPWSAPWNTTLSVFDKQFISAVYPGTDGGNPGEELGCACSESITGIACEDFETLTSQSYPQADHWKPWSTNGDMGELQTYSWGKVLKIQYEASNNPDVVYAPTILSEGVYKMSWEQYVGTNNSAYFNMQKDEEIGEEFGAQFYFDKESTGQIKINEQVIDFSYAQNKWLNLVLIIDIANDQVNFFIDDTLIGSFPNSWSARTSNGSNQFSMLNFYAIDADARFWLDDFCLSISEDETILAQTSLRGDGVMTPPKM